MRILAICPIKFDGTSYYRAYGIFPHLKKLFAADGETFEVHPYFENGTYSWADLLPYDILFLQRPAQFAAKHVKFIKYMKMMGKKVWIDYDDNLFQVPTENRVYDEITQTVKESMVYVMGLADLITVSTPGLKNLYNAIPINTRVEVIPNAWNFGLHGFADKYNAVKPVPPPQKSKTKFAWRGSETHQGDLASAGEVILKAIAHHQDSAHWTFMGYNPWMLTENIPMSLWAHMTSEDIFYYFDNLKRLAPQVMFFPLRLNEFNLCKSNIAWMEATFAGSVCIAPDIPEWDKPGVIRYKDEEDLLTQLTASQVNYEQNWSQSADYIRTHLSLDVVNEQRKHILKSLL